MAHDHGHDHHHGGSSRDYFTEQLLTILVCGLFGYAGIRLYLTGALQHLLIPEFQVAVLVGGIGVTVIVLIRAITVWREAGEMHSHDQGHHHDHGHDHAHHHHHEHGAACDHDHGPGCDHDHHHDHGHDHHHHHDHAADDHGHSHDLSWVMVRMMVLFFPVALFFLGVPNAGLSPEYLIKLAAREEKPLEVGDGQQVAAKEGVVSRFADLNDAAYDPARREALEGQTAELEGRFQQLGAKEFSLYRFRMTCCASDTTALKARIRTDQALTGFNPHDWVKVTGRIQFVKVKGKEGRDEYVPLIRADLAQVQKKQVDQSSDYER